MRGLIPGAFCVALLFGAGGAAAAPMTFQLSGTGGNCDGCEWVAAQGEITRDTPDRFREFLRGGGVHYIILNSPGGDLMAGMELGRLIRASGARTGIGKTIQLEGEDAHLEDLEAGVCASACAFAFMGGMDRYVDSKDRLGVHQFAGREREISAATTQMLAGLSLLYTVEMGIDPRVIVAASATTPDDIYWFTDEEAKLFKLDTTTEQTEPWKLEPAGRGLDLVTTHHSSASRSVDISLACIASDGRWRLLIMEKAPFYAARHKAGERIFDFSRQGYEPRSRVSIGDQEYELGREDFESEAFYDDILTVLVRLPPAMDNAGGMNFEFSPDLARAFGDLTWVSVTLPPQEWIAAARRNCHV